MSKHSDGGPAFPKPATVWDGRIEDPARDGMTLRDWFAGQALSGMYRDGCPANTIDALASDAYRMADAMLAARR